MRPGCGSLSVDPDRVDELRVRFEGGRLRSRRIELAALEDDIEAMFVRGWTDGLPVVPPTEQRVLAMLEGTTRAADEIVATVPPDLVDVTVEKVAIAAVMAGCRPEYLPWVLTVIEAVCTDEFNMHGVLATTMPVGPVIVCSGPGTVAIGMNSGVNALGQGNRANLTIGRAVQLVVRNVGGGRPGGVDRATHGNPGKLSFCFAERPDSPFGTLAESRGAADGGERHHGVRRRRAAVHRRPAVAGAGEPRQVAGRVPADVAPPQARAGVRRRSSSLGPEHARVFADAGWDRQRVLVELDACLQLPGAELVRGAGGIAEGVPEQFADATLPKFRPGGVLLACAGGAAGLFSAMIGGWANGAVGSQPVTREVGT